MGKSATETFIDIMSGCNCGRRLYTDYIETEWIYEKISPEIPELHVFSESINEIHGRRNYVSSNTIRNLNDEYERREYNKMNVYARFLCNQSIKNTSFAVAYRHVWFRLNSNQCVKWKKDGEEYYININFILDKNKRKIMALYTSPDNESVLIVSPRCIGSSNTIHKTIVNNIVPAFINVFNGSVLFRDMSGETMGYQDRYSDENTINNKLNNKLKFLSNISYF